MRRKKANERKARESVKEYGSWKIGMRQYGGGRQRRNLLDQGNKEKKGRKEEGMEGKEEKVEG